MPLPPKLTDAERREIALAFNHQSVTDLVERYGISRARVYQIRKEYEDLEALAELEKEVEVRRSVTRRKKEE